MKRRRFLQFLGAAPVVAAMPALPQLGSAPAIAVDLAAPGADMTALTLMMEAMEKAINPPLIYTGTEIYELRVDPGGVSFLPLSLERDLWRKA